jgi:hypothetical protein
LADGVATVTQIDSSRIQLRPGQVCRALLQALEAAEGQTRRRKRDQAPDRLGLATKRDILERAVEADPAADEFEGWLVAQIAAADGPGAGAVRAMCEEIFQDYRMALLQPQMAHWLQHGAPSDDADPASQGGRRRRGKGDGSGKDDRWRGTDDVEFACTCHLPQR